VAASADSGVTPDQACGLFSDLGLTLVTSMSVITGQQHEDEIKLTNPDTGK
jgi:hypothetical protein